MYLLAGKDCFDLLGSTSSRRRVIGALTVIDESENFVDLVLDWDSCLYSKIVDERKCWYFKLGRVSEAPLEYTLVPPANTKTSESSQAVICGHKVYVLNKLSDRSELLVVNLESSVLDRAESQPLLLQMEHLEVKPDVNIVGISSNGKDLLAIDSQGGIYCVPDLLWRFEGHRFKKICSGHGFHVVLTDTGAVYAWGSGNHGELGTRISRMETLEPQRVSFFDDLPCIVADIVCGGWHTMALTSDGDVYTWGWNESGQLGQSDEIVVSVTSDPAPVDIGSAENPVEQIAAGARHSLARLRNGDIYAWGSNKFSQLGNDKEIQVAREPVLVSEGLGKIYNVHNVMSGQWSCILNVQNVS